MKHPQRPKRGRPRDDEARVIALKLAREIDASPYTVRQLADAAGMTYSEYTATLHALAGRRAARHHVERIAAALESLTSTTS